MKATLTVLNTHPSQSCFMSSLDLHTHSGFQWMLPESTCQLSQTTSHPHLAQPASCTLSWPSTSPFTCTLIWPPEPPPIVHPPNFLVTSYSFTGMMHCPIALATARWAVYTCRCSNKPTSSTGLRHGHQCTRKQATVAQLVHSPINWHGSGASTPAVWI